jgi:MFS family permease
VAEQRDGETAADVGRAFAQAVGRLFGWLWRLIRGEVIELVGGPARARVIVLFGAVLALGGADSATVGAVAPELEHALHIGNAKVGLLSSVALLVGAVFTIPVGLFVDRVKRMPMLALSILLWSLASLLGAFASSYSSLLVSRLLLGAVTATAGPAIASLTGDYFPPQERGRVYAYILAGESAGTAVGFIISGTLASVFTWRAAFVVLAIPGFFLARELWRTVPEPHRGGQSWLESGALELTAAPRRGAGEPHAGTPAADDEGIDLAYEAAQRMGVEPDPERVLREDPGKMGLWRAVRYTLSVPTNLLLTVGSSLGYFYFAGLQTFALLFVKGHYHASQATAELVLALLVGGALVGTLAGGRLTDVLLHRGQLEARIWVPAGCYIGAAVLLIPGFIGTHLTPALWFDVAGAGLIAAANPPSQAARLDIMPAFLWGRAESTRTFVRSIAQALAPLVFGGFADLIAGFAPSQAPIGTHPHAPSAHASTGLEVSFLIMLTTLVAAGVFTARARRTYATDVATAAASEQQTKRPVSPARRALRPQP